MGYGILLPLVPPYLGYVLGGRCGGSYGILLPPRHSVQKIKSAFFSWEIPKRV